MMIPTLAATGSEADAGGVITNWETHEKVPLIHPLLFPRVSIIDPELTISVPRDYTIDGGIDIICHVIEGFFTGAEKTPIQDRFSMAVVKTVMENLPRAMDQPDDIDARSQLSWCSTVALSGMINSGRGGAFPLHAMEHALSGYYDISHGRGLAVLLPRLMYYTCDSRPEKFVFMGEALFGSEPKERDQEVAHGAVYGMIDWLKSVERYLVLPEVGVKDDTKFASMADDTIRIYSAGDYLDNPKKLYKKDIIRIFDMCMSELPLQKW
jgi:alcohol dehydrogenase YqhD (iron-dependent ADH family)